MSFREVCERWAHDLSSNVAELTDAKIHLYASWSVETLTAELGEINLAVWPEPSPQKIEPLATGSPPSDMVTTIYVVLIWKNAELDTSRFTDDQDAAGAWLDLAEQVLGRLRVFANTSMGSPSGLTKVAGISWDLSGGMWTLSAAFTVRAPVSFT